MRKPILIANWKMNGSLHSNQALLVRMLAKFRPFRKTIDMAICSPFPYLFQVRALLGYTGIALCAQHTILAPSGAQPRYVRSPLFQSQASRTVIAAHSYRRSLYV